MREGEPPRQGLHTTHVSSIIEMMLPPARLLGTLGHDVRLTILRVLLTRPAGLVAGEIQRHVRVPASTLSHHLELLMRAGVVAQRREGKFRRYRAMPQTLLPLLETLAAACRGGSEAPAPESSVLCD